MTTTRKTKKRIAWTSTPPLSTSTTISRKRKSEDFDDSEAQKELMKALGEAANAFGELLCGVIKDAAERGVRDGFREARRKERGKKRRKS